MDKPILRATWDNSDYHRVVSELMKRVRYKSLPAFLKWRGKIVAQDLIRWTPPRGPSPGLENPTSMKKRGERSLRSDVRKVFKPMGQLGVVKNPDWAPQFRKAIRQHDEVALKELLLRANVPTDRVLFTMDRRLHEQLRTNRGRVRSSMVIQVVNEPSLKRYISQRQRRVGALKAGWVGPAMRLGVRQGSRGIPAWVMKQTVRQGRLIDQSTALASPSLTLINREAGRYKGIDAGGIVDGALEANLHKMKIELRKMLEREAKLFNRATSKRLGF